MNSSGTVVGTAATKQNQHAFRWINGTMTDLGQLGKGGYSIAMDVNDSGLTVGETAVTVGSTQTRHAFKYDTSMHDIGTLPGSTISIAFGVNTAGTIVGMSWGPNGSNPWHPFVYSNGSMTQLPTLPGWNNGRAYDINDNGVIVGKAQDAWGSNNLEVDHAAMWDASHTNITDLTPGFYASGALGVNSRGDIVGYVNDGNTEISGYRGFIYTNGQYFDLTQLYDPTGTSGWVINSATGINDSGQIAALATHNGQVRVVRLSPTSIVATTIPSVIGATLSPLKLTAQQGTWTGMPTSYTYEWYRCSPTCVDTGTSGSSYTLSTLDIGSRISYQVTAHGNYGSGSVMSTQSAVIASALSVYAPQMRYDLRDYLRADAATEITDNCDPTSGDENLLEGNAGGVFIPFASSCPPNGDPWTDQLTLPFLGPQTYSSGRPAFESDKIDEAGGGSDTTTYQQDFQRMHGNPLYANQIYGRAVGNADGSTTLQYWFFYYTQPNFWFGLGGAHEGDWEGMQVTLDSTPQRLPTVVTYFQHHGGETCPWSKVEQGDAGHPLVFVANGSHASYLFGGAHDIPGLYNDEANGDSSDSPIPAVIDVSATPGWIQWPGHWGGTTKGSTNPEDQDSPQGPALTGTKWTDPLQWGAQFTCAS